MKTTKRSRVARHRRTAVAGLVLALLPGTAGAEVTLQPSVESTLAVTEGARVRVRASGLREKALIGTVLEITDLSLIVAPDDESAVEVARDSITRIDVSVGRGGRAKKGALVGALIGAALFVPFCPSDFDFRSGAGGCSAGDRVGTAAVGALGGAMYGALIGHLIKRDTWVPLGDGAARLTLAPAPGRGVAVGVTFEF